MANEIKGLVNITTGAGVSDADARYPVLTGGKIAESVLPVTAYGTPFVNADLAAGILTVTHSLGQKVVNVVVSDNNDKVVIPDNITFTDTNNLTVDLTSYGTITGTWTVNVIKAGGAGLAGLAWEIITVSADAAVSEGYFIDATSNIVTLTLPATPIAGQQVGIRVLDISNTVTIGRNGSNIEGVASDLVVDTAGFYCILTFSNSTYGWERTN